MNSLNHKVKPKEGEVWYANFPFQECDEYKGRPVLVVGEIDEDYEVFALMITTTKQKPNSKYKTYEYTIQSWKDAGLNYQSYVRVDRQEILQEHQFSYRIGKMSARDFDNVGNLLNEFLQSEDAV